jgi:undecaprenyl-diphosphatase
MSSRSRLLLESASTAFLGALTSFLLLSVLYAELGRLSAFDLSFQAEIHGWTQPLLTRIMLGFSFIGSIKIFIPTLILAVIVFLVLGEKEGGIRRMRKRNTTALFALGIGGALVLNELFKTYFHRARPNVPWSIGDEHTFSFPSGHSLFSSVLYGLIAYLVLARHTPLPRRALAAILAIAMALAIGLSRIYLGMHFPTDVLAGYITGVCWLITTILIDRRWNAHSVRTRTVRSIL